jgi:hypothetical protein
VKKALLSALVAALVVVAAASAARDPRLEKLALRPPDVALAKRATVQRVDLPAGWRQVRPTAGAPEAPDCPGYRPDFSRFTITGQGETEFTSTDGTRSIASRTEVYATKADARGDLALATLPPVARCLGRIFREGAEAGAPEGVTITVVSSRRVAAPRVGERSAAYRIVSEVGAAGRTARVYVDVVIALRGRTIAAVFFTGGGRPVPGQARLMARLATRLR